MCMLKIVYENWIDSRGPWTWLWHAKGQIDLYSTKYICQWIENSNCEIILPHQ